MKTKQPKDFSFENFAESYDNGIAAKGSRKFYKLLLREIETRPGAALLDVGCGTGALLKLITDTYDIKGYGIDAEKNMIAAAQRNYPQMRFSVGVCDKLPFGDQSFDAMIACMAYHHFGNKEGFAKEAARVLKPGGILYIADPRFPWIVRKTMNGILRLFRVAGEFFSSDEITARFLHMGFVGMGAAADGYAQVVMLQRKREEAVPK